MAPGIGAHVPSVASSQRSHAYAKVIGPAPLHWPRSPIETTLSRCTAGTNGAAVLAGGAGRLSVAIGGSWSDTLCPSVPRSK